MSEKNALGNVDIAVVHLDSAKEGALEVNIKVVKDFRKKLSLLEINCKVQLQSNELVLAAGVKLLVLE